MKKIKGVLINCLKIVIAFSIITGCSPDHRTEQSASGITELNPPEYKNITKAISIYSNGEKSGYQMQFIRAHRGSGADGVIGEYLHLYWGSDVDDDLFGIRFYEADGTTPIVHRRMISETGQ